MSTKRGRPRIYSGSDKERRRSARLARIDKRKAVMDAYKAAQGCQTCDENTPVALDFHHRDPDTKVANVSSLRFASPQRIMEEMAKCDIQCANCHRKDSLQNQSFNNR